jgi:hypothetical protein
VTDTTGQRPGPILIPPVMGGVADRSRAAKHASASAAQLRAAAAISALVNS